ncbi:MAG: biopolymer transporter ExbD [Myxococcota bacterium]|nr:biopolymer transporter ExbD [Myxococcota bacterium]MDW8361416.1 biopolymer transporter ExbD [Myxococcales bacterium]
MGGINVGGGGHGGKKPLDSEIPLIPFIDLLLCCVMFLLVTAVWNQLARINANQQQPGQQAPQDAPPQERDKLVLQIQTTGYTLVSTASGDRTVIPKVGDAFDQEGLRNKLIERRQLDRNRRDIIVAPEDGVLYADVVAAMDIVVGEGFRDMSLSDGAAL